MNKYQEALDCLKDTKCDEINNCKLCSLTSYCGHYQCVKTLQELVDTTKTPTLEEVKKEWEELGYTWEENEIYIHITKRDKLLCVTKNICLTKQDKEYCCYDEDEDYSCLNINFKEHQLLTKTFRALGWEV